VRFESKLEDHLNPADTETTLRAVIGCGRYAELFIYDDETQTFGINETELKICSPRQPTGPQGAIDHERVHRSNESIFDNSQGLNLCLG